MANTFPNAKNQHLKNYVPVWTKKEMTDAAPSDYIDISWIDTEDDLVFDEKKLVTTETIKKLDQKITDNFEQKADEIIEKAIEHHIEDVKKVKEIASTLKKSIDDEIARAEQAEHSLDLRVSNNNRLASQALARILDEEKTRKEDIEYLRKNDIESALRVARTALGTAQDEAKKTKAAIEEVNNTIIEKENNLATMISGIHHELATEMTQRELEDKNLAVMISGIHSELATETTQREIADKKLQANIDALISENSSIHDEINARINEEISNRQIADSDLEKKIADESAAREEQDTHLKWLIGDTESKLSANIESESKYLSGRLEGLIGGVVSKIDAEKSNREKADEEIRAELEKATGSEHVIELQKKALTSVNITLDASDGFALVKDLPTSYTFIEFKHVKGANMAPIYFHPEVIKMDDNSTLVLFFEDGTPENKDEYKNIIATYICPISETLKD